MLRAACRERGEPPAVVLTQKQTRRRSTRTGPRAGIAFWCGSYEPSAGEGRDDSRLPADGKAHWLLAHCSVLKVRAANQKVGTFGKGPRQRVPMVARRRGGNEPKGSQVDRPAPFREPHRSLRNRRLLTCRTFPL